MIYAIAWALGCLVLIVLHLRSTRPAHPCKSAGCAGGDTIKVLYAGLPGVYCERCHALHGLARYASELIFTGVFFAYPAGCSYLEALRAWLTTGPDDDDFGDGMGGAHP